MKVNKDISTKIYTKKVRKCFENIKKYKVEVYPYEVTEGSLVKYENK